MNTINPTSANVYDSLGLSSSQTTAATDEKLDEFMTLLLAQMENQDPLEPMENGEFLAQLAQIETAGGIKDLNNSINDFALSMQSNQALQASTLVGRNVLVDGSNVQLQPQGGAEGTADLPVSTSSTRILIHDASGQLVRSMDLGQQQAGTVNFSWDGMDGSGNRALPGNYSITAEAAIDGQMQALNTKVVAAVESVTLGQGGREISLNVAGVGDVALSRVNKIM